MDDFKDPYLENKGISTGYGTRFSTIPKRILSIVAAYLEVVWRVRSETGKRVPIEEIFQTVVVIFSDDAFRARDVLWMQHCAVSLRELLDLQIPGDFCAAFKNFPEYIQDGIPFQPYQRLIDFRGFYNDIVHFRDGGALQKAKDLIGNQKIKAIDAEIFEQICFESIRELYNLFAKFCLKKQETI